MPTLQCRTSAQFEYHAFVRARGQHASELRLDLPCNGEAPAAAREQLRRLGWLGWRLGDAMLVTSELVSNAVLHSGAREHESLQVAVKLQGDSLLVTVTDPGHSSSAAKPAGGGDHFGGFGLRLIDQLADRWGSQRAGDHRVWAELSLGGPDRGPSSSEF